MFNVDKPHSTKELHDFSYRMPAELQIMAYFKIYAPVSIDEWCENDDNDVTPSWITDEKWNWKDETGISNLYLKKNAF